MERARDFEALYDEMWPRVYRYAAARLGQTDGEDLTAEVFHAVLEAIMDERADVTPNWVMTVARNKIVDRWRRAERRRNALTRMRPNVINLVSEPYDWPSNPRWEAVMSTLDKLPVRDRSLLLLHHVDGVTIKELAATSDSTTAAIESALARARRAFRKCYAEATV